MTATRVAVGDERLVYAICADQNFKYPLGSSPVVYFGTTRNGVARIAASVAHRAYDILGEHGVTAFEVRIITTPPRRGIKTWLLLERALLIGFKKRYGDVPFCNTHGRGYVERREFEVFAYTRVQKVLSNLEDNGKATARKPIGPEVDWDLEAE